MALELREPEHEYFWDGRRVPGVHDALKAAAMIDDRWYTEEGKYKGNYVDAGCSLIVQDNLDWSTVRPEFEHALREFERFLSDTGFEVYETKRRGYHSTWNFAGEWDIFGKFPNRNIEAVIDIKATASVEDWWKLQTAAYAAIKNQEIRHAPKRYSLRLPPKGSYVLDPHEDHNDLKVFLACLTICNRKGL